MSEGSPKTKKEHWFNDWLTYGSSCWLAGLPIILIMIVIVGLTIPSLYKAKEKFLRQGVVIYTSQDQVYAEPILKEFEQQSGIEVRAVFDSDLLGWSPEKIAASNPPFTPASSPGGGR